jgi:hypothetical protein
MRNIKGKQGTWDVATKYGKLPCVHQYFWRVDERGPCYHDPRFTPAAFGHRPKFQKYMELLHSIKTVVVTTDTINKDHSEGADGYFSRTGYVGIFKVDDIELDGNGLRFRFVKRLPQ